MDDELQDTLNRVRAARRDVQVSGAILDELFPEDAPRVTTPPVTCDTCGWPFARIRPTCPDAALHFSAE